MHWRPCARFVCKQAQPPSIGLPSSHIPCRYAACVLSLLTSSVAGVEPEMVSANCAAVVQAGGVEPLVGLLKHGSDGAKKYATITLSQLALGDSTGAEPEAQDQITTAGAVASLIQWLHDASLGPPALAARALECLAKDNTDTQTTIAEAGAIAPLVRMARGVDGDGTEGSRVAQHEGNGPLADAVAEGIGAGPTVAAQKAALIIMAKAKAKAQLEGQRCAAGALAALAEHHKINQIIVAAEGGIPPLVELLKRENATSPHENATRALWHCASDADNKLAVARAGGLPPLIRVLTTGSEQAQEWATAAIEALARDCPENQRHLCAAGAVEPLVQQLGSDVQATQYHAQGALLHIASPTDSNRNAVVKPLIGLLGVRNASATLMATKLIAMLGARASSNCAAIVGEGAIAPLVGLLGDGRNASELQVRVADALFFLSRSVEGKADIVKHGGVQPLVRMLSSANQEAQARASGALWHLAASSAAQQLIVSVGGVQLLVILLSSPRLDCAKHAAGALWRLEGGHADIKGAIVKAGGILPLVVLLGRSESPEAQELAAGVLSDLAKEKASIGNKRSIINVGGVKQLAKLLSNGTPGAQKHASCALWGLTLEGEYLREVVDADAVPLLVELLTNGDENVQGHAAAALSNVASDPKARSSLLELNAIEPLLALSKGPPTWLRAQATDILRQFDVEIPGFQADANEGAGGSTATGSGSSVWSEKKRAAKGRRTKRGEPSPRKSGGGATKRGDPATKKGRGAESHRPSKPAMSSRGAESHRLPKPASSRKPNVAARIGA